MEKKILLVDDDIDELEIFVDALNKLSLNFSCMQALNTEEAIEFLLHSKPDYIFIDFNMPRTNGLEALKKLKGVYGDENARYIIYSNFISPETEKEAIGAGALTCMKKPSLTAALTLLLRKIILDN